MQNNKQVRVYQKSPIIKSEDIELYLRVSGNQSLEFDEQKFEFENAVLKLKAGLEANLDISKADFSELEIVLEKNAKLNLSCKDNQDLRSLKIVLQESASLHFDYRNALSLQLFENVIEQASFSQTRLNYLTESNARHKVQVAVNMRGKQAQTNLQALSYLREKALACGFFSLNFFDKSNQANMQIRALLDDRAYLDSHAKIFISPEAGKTDSYMKQEIFLLEKSARAKAMPELSIMTNDVQAGHGVSVSGLDAEQVFYLNSRGLNSAQAKDLIIESYFVDMQKNFW